MIEKNKESIVESIDNDINLESDRIANWLLKFYLQEKVEINPHLVVEKFIVNVILKLNVGFYESIGIIEEVKASYRNIMLDAGEEDDK